MKATEGQTMHSGCEPERWRLIDMVIRDEGCRHYAATMTVFGNTSASQDYIAGVSTQLSTLVAKGEVVAEEKALRDKYEELWRAGLG